MSIFGKVLSLEAKNSTVSEFESLVENASAAVDSAASAVSNLGVVSTVSNITGKYTANTMSKLNSYAAKNTKFVGKTVSSIKSAASNKVGNTVNNIKGAVSNIASTVSNTASNVTSKISNISNMHMPDVSQIVPEIKLDRELYDKALSLPEAKSVSLYCEEAVNNLQYGTFVGGTVFKDFNGTISDTVKNVQPISGWVTLSNKSDTYAWVTNNTTTYIVPINKISPEPVVEDFQPLYDKLKDNQYSKDDLVVNDTILEQSKAATFKEVSSEAINNEAEDTVKHAYGSVSDLNDAKFKYGLINGTRVSNSNSEHVDTKQYAHGYEYKGVVYPRQIYKRNTSIINDNVYNNVQAVVYDLAKDGETEVSALEACGFDTSQNMLLCYQQPENIAYTAASQFDSPAPRGSQQPFQFYISSNAMNLNFTLKWHIDEIRTLIDKENKNYSIQDIAQIAEGFTRPWKRGNSVEPKLCKVILPGVQHIGYITEAQISYSGDMSGDYMSGGGVLKNDTSARNVTDYFYSQIDVTFTMIIVKDINLKSKSDTRREMIIYNEEPTSNPPSYQENKPASSSGENTEIKNNSGNQEIVSTSAPVGASSSTSPTDEIATSDGQNMSVAPKVMQEPVYSNDVDANGNALLIDNTNNIIYSSEGEPPGVFKDQNSNDELFMANGTPRPVVSQDIDGNRYYLAEDGETIVKADTSGSDYIKNSDGSVSVQISR